MESVLERTLVEQWRELVACKVRVWSALEQELEKRHGLSASEFEVMDQLSEYEIEALPRVQELAEHVPVTQSALSRLLGRLESQGLIERTLCTIDRRGIYVRLTEAGQARLGEARPTHRAVLASEMVDAPEMADASETAHAAETADASETARADGGSLALVGE